MEKWYKNCYRRNLVDMHINDDKEIYLSKFSVEDYFNYLVEAKIQSPMIYLQSHTGLCNFKTSVSKTHAHFLKHPHQIKELIDKCQQSGMKVVGYYSLIFNNQACLDHPSWEKKYRDGETYINKGQRYGLCCPNNEEYRKFVVTQIQEIAEQFPNLDGIFYDMPFWSFDCACESCQKKWGKEIPLKNFEDKNYLEFIKAKQVWMGEFVKFVKNITNKYLPNTTVEFNFAAVIGCDYIAGSTELINEECEFTGGDLYGDLYNHSFTAKYYYQISKNQPFEYMTCRCNDLLREHTINKPLIQLENEIMLSCFHHGASLIIDAINPDGTLDSRVAKTLKKAFESQIPYEKYMSFGKLKGDIGVYFDSCVQYPFLKQPYNKEININLSKTLIENHIPFRILANNHLDDLNCYKMIFAPALSDFDNEDRLQLIDYDKNGGVLYLSGFTDKRLLKEFFDAEIIGTTNDGSKFPIIDRGFPEVYTYINMDDEKYQKMFSDFNKEYPLPLRYHLPLIKYKKGDAKGKIVLPYTDPNDNYHYASIHSNPPGREIDYPSLIEAKYGNQTRRE